MTEQTVADIDLWKATVLEPAIADVHNGDRAAAQARLLSPRNDESIAKVGIPITTVMEERVKEQLKSEQSSRTALIVSGVVIAVALLALIAGALAFLLPLRRRVVIPLEDIAGASKRIGDGDFSARVDAKASTKPARRGRLQSDGRHR